MIFELKFRSVSNKAKYAYKSAVLKFLFDNNSLKEEIEEFESDTDLKINKVKARKLSVKPVILCFILIYRIALGNCSHGRLPRPLSSAVNDRGYNYCPLPIPHSPFPIP